MLLATSPIARENAISNFADAREMENCNLAGPEPVRLWLKWLGAKRTRIKRAPPLEAYNHPPAGELVAEDPESLAAGLYRCTTCRGSIFTVGDKDPILL